MPRSQRLRSHRSAALDRAPRPAAARQEERSESRRCRRRLLACWDYEPPRESACCRHDRKDRNHRG